MGLGTDFFLWVFLLISFIIAFNDFLSYKIPNTLLLTLIGLFLIRNLFFQNFSMLQLPLLYSCIVIAVGFILFFFKVFGAGDAKFLAVASLWMTEFGMMKFLIWVCLLGGGLAIIYMTLNPWITMIRLKIMSKIKILPSEHIFKKILVLENPEGNYDPEIEKKMFGSRLLPYGIAIFLAEIVNFFHGTIR